MKELGKVDVGIKVPGYMFSGYHTTPKLASVLEVLLLEILNSGKFNELGMDIEEVLTEYFDIPDTMLYLFEEILGKFYERNIMKFDFYSKVDNYLDLWINDAALTPKGEKILKDKKVPGVETFFESSKAIHYSGIYENSSKKLMPNASKRIILEEATTVKEEKVLEEFKRLFTKVVKGSNSDSEFSEEIDVSVGKAKYYHESLNLILEDGRLSFSHSNPKVLELLGHNDMSDLEERDTPFRYLHREVSEVTSIDERFKIFDAERPNKIIITKGEGHSEKKISAEEHNIDLAGYDYVGKTKDQRPYLFKYVNVPVNGLLVPLVLEEYKDMKDYDKIVMQYISKKLYELSNISKMEEFFTNFIDTLHLVRKMKYTEVLESYLETLVNSNTAISINEVVKVFKGLKGQMKKNKLEIININRVRAGKIEECFTRYYSKTQDIAGSIKVFSDLYQENKGGLLTLVREKFTGSQDELLSDISGLFSEELLVNEFNLKSLYNKSFIDGKLSDILHNLPLLEKYRELYNDKKNLESLTGIKDRTNYTLPKFKLIEEIKAKKNKLNSSFNKLKSRVDLQIKTEIEREVKFYEDLIRMMNEAKLRNEVDDTKVTFGQAQVFIDSENYNLASYTIRRVVEKFCDEEVLKGREMLEKHFKKNVKKAHQHWRNLNREIHGEKSIKKKDLIEALKFFRNQIGGDMNE